MKLNNRFIFGILSLLLAAVIAFVALPTIARQTNGKEEIVRITQPVLKGEQISSENAEVVEVEGYIFVCAILCSMMIVTTFSFDDSSKWTRYAMIMPVSKKELVAGKFMVLAIFCAIGSLFGLVVGSIGGLITNKITLDLVGIGELLFLDLISWVIALIFGSMSIPLVFKFGAERGRVLLLVSFLIPAGICFGIYQLLTTLGIELTDQLVFILLCCSPLLALAWCYVMYQISYRIFAKQEL